MRAVDEVGRDVHVQSNAPRTSSRARTLGTGCSRFSWGDIANLIVYNRGHKMRGCGVTFALTEVVAPEAGLQNVPVALEDDCAFHKP